MGYKIRLTQTLKLRRQAVKLPVELEDTLAVGKSQRRRGHLDKVSQKLQLSQPLKDPSDPQKL